MRELQLVPRWFQDDCTVAKGENELLFEGSDTTRIYCKGCFTTLIVGHPAYAGRIVLTQASNYKDFEARQGAKPCAPRPGTSLRACLGIKRQNCMRREAPLVRCVREFPTTCWPLSRIWRRLVPPVP